MRQLTEILDKENILFRLNKVNYERVEHSNAEFDIIIDDSFQISEIHEDMFSVLLSRHVSFEPESLFDITVEFEVARWRDKNATESFEDYDLNDIINNDNIDELTGYNYNRASAIISAVTTSFGLTPLITPPVFVYDKESE